ncbi:hypothetical protein BHE90_011494 [Fusarium euwallaceae]|uniref:Uncharacterized protein n=1 Tax=Fusarium euwallaceae TaxID=1147111 RepID=A0A430LED7_9HYPO|nr:hypothetical protein BHE90_011494 [Fusarium euwallaceae]
MAAPDKPRRRFAPEPIETTFETFRSKTGKQKQVLSSSKNHHNDQHQPKTPPCTMGPNPEPTPEASPRSPSPVPQELRPKRRFAPQLIETSRRSRRVGDTGPATKPTDKTDITPYTRNIYTATKHRGRRRGDDHNDEEPPVVNGARRRESEDENVMSYLLELAAKEAERQMQEAALAAFPNSHQREGNVDHFYFRESSGSDNSPESTSPVHHGHPPIGAHHNVRRQSSDANLSWWHKHMQEHAEQVLQEQKHDDPMVLDEPELKQGEMATLAEEPHEDHTHAARKQGEDTVMRTDTADLDKMDLTAPPDPMWTTSNNQHAPPAGRKRSSPGAPGPIGETYMPLLQTDSYLTAEQTNKAASPAPAPSRHIGESPMPYIPSAASGRSDVPYAKASQIPPDTGGFRNSGRGFGRPFGGFGHRSPAPPFQKRRQAVSPPMLGKDLVFRRCPSPKQTKLEPDHPFAERHAEEKYRDLSGEKGLWRGYCFRSESNDAYLVPADLHAPPMLATPKPPATPGTASHISSPSFTDEPAAINGASNGLYNGQTNGTNGTKEHRTRAGNPKGLHMLHGIDERLQQEKAHAELEEKIAQEFDDGFVTQVYNYLSLGYPAMARAFDEELSRISLMSIDDLEKDDDQQLAKGHLVEADDGTPRDKRCPRWRALRSYIKEWARQHPNLDSMDPVGWGVRERRGSWAV